MEPDGPNRLWVADLTYVAVVGRFVHVGLVIAALSRRIAGWAIRDSDFFEDVPSHSRLVMRRSDDTGMRQAELRDERSMSGGRTVFAVLAAPGLLLCLGVGCGGDSSAPTTSPGPAASPPTSPAPPPAPAVRALTITTAPFDPRGYAVSETIGVQVTFSEAVTVSGSPLLKLGIGENVRDAVWDAEASDGAFCRVSLRGDA